MTLVEAQAAGIFCVVSDHVPEACALTEQMRYVPLKENAQVWAKQLCAPEITREDSRHVLAQAGYDIRTNALWLQDYYLKTWERNA